MVDKAKLKLDVPYKDVAGRLSTSLTVSGWMQDRRKLPQDWANRLKAAQIKSEELREHFPQNHDEAAMRDIHSYIGKQPADLFNFTHCEEVFTKLTTTTKEGAETNFIGRYKSPLTKDWNLLLNIYKKENLYLAEQGKLLAQLQGYDLPSLKKQTAQLKKQITECQQREVDVARLVKDNRAQFMAGFQARGMVATENEADVENQVYASVAVLKDKFEEVDSQVRDPTVTQAIQYYDLFSDHQGNQTGKELGMLRYISKEGDVLTKTYAGDREENKERHKYDIYSKFVEFMTGGAQEKTLEFNWEEGGGAGDSSDKPADSLKQSQEWEVVEELSVQDAAELETLLYHTESRQLLINDITELQFFLKLRKEELQTPNSIAAAYESAKSPELQKLDKIEFINQGLSHLHQLLTAITNKDFLALLLIRQKPQVAAKRVTQKLMLPLKLIAKYEAETVNLTKKVKQVKEELKEAEQQIKEKDAMVKQLTARIEIDLSAVVGAQVKVGM